jgi:hypothetical protein
MGAKCVDCKRTGEFQHNCHKCKAPLHNLCGAVHGASEDMETYCCKCNSEKREVCSKDGKHVELIGMDHDDVDALDTGTILNCIQSLSLAQLDDLSAEHSRIRGVLDTLNNKNSQESYQIGQTFKEQMDAFYKSLYHWSWVDKQGNCGPGTPKTLNI